MEQQQYDNLQQLVDGGLNLDKINEVRICMKDMILWVIFVRMGGLC